MPYKEDHLLSLSIPASFQYGSTHHGFSYYFDPRSHSYYVSSARLYRLGKPLWYKLFSLAELGETPSEVTLLSVQHALGVPQKILLTLKKAQKKYFSLIEVKKENKIKILVNNLQGEEALWQNSLNVWLQEKGRVYLLQQKNNWRKEKALFIGSRSLLIQQLNDPHGSPLTIIHEKDCSYSYQKNGSFIPIALPKNSFIAGINRGKVIFYLKNSWTRRKITVPANSLFAVSLNNGQWGSPIPIWHGANGEEISEIAVSRNYVYFSYQHHHQSWGYFFSLPNGPDQAIPLELNPCFRLIDQPWRSDLFYFLSQQQEEKFLYTYDSNQRELTVLRREKSLKLAK